MEERDNLLNQVHLLKVTLISANLRLPPGLEDPPPPNEATSLSEFDMSSAIVSYSNDDTNHQRLHVNWPEATVPACAPVSNSSYGMTNAYGSQSQTYHQPKTEPDFPNGRPFFSSSSNFAWPG